MVALPLPPSLRVGLSGGQSDEIKPSLSRVPPKGAEGVSPLPSSDRERLPQSASLTAPSGREPGRGTTASVLQRHDAWAARRATPVQRSRFHGLPGNRRGPPRARQRRERPQPAERARWTPLWFMPVLYIPPPPQTPGSRGESPWWFSPRFCHQKRGAGRAGPPPGASRRSGVRTPPHPSRLRRATFPPRGKASGGWYPPLRSCGTARAGPHAFPPPPGPGRARPKKEFLFYSSMCCVPAEILV